MIIRAVVQAREKNSPFNFQTFPRDFFVDRSSTVSFVINDLGRGKVNLLLCFQNFIKYTSNQFFFFFIYWFWFLLLSLQINLSIQTLIGALIFFSSCFFEKSHCYKNQKALVSCTANSEGMSVLFVPVCLQLHTSVKLPRIFRWLGFLIGNKSRQQSRSPKGSSKSLSM